ncbi:MAG: PTS sugar transporter subunit IIA [Vagococcus fluvialis]
MFKLFGRKKGNEIELHSVAKGEVIPITEVSDPVFSQKMMGDGYAVKPSSNQVFAPISGKVVSIFPTKHAIAIQSENGLECLLHMGIDTVDLKGVHFDIHVKEGDFITPTTQLATVDLEALKKADKQSDLIVVFTNFSDVVDSFNLSKVEQSSEQDVVGSITLK